jgi:hypothetical protein
MVRQQRTHSGGGGAGGRWGGAGRGGAGRGGAGRGGAGRGGAGRGEAGRGGAGTDAVGAQPWEVTAARRRARSQLLRQHADTARRPCAVLACALSPRGHGPGLAHSNPPLPAPQRPGISTAAPVAFTAWGYGNSELAPPFVEVLPARLQRGCGRCAHSFPVCACTAHLCWRRLSMLKQPHAKFSSQTQPNPHLQPPASALINDDIVLPNCSLAAMPVRSPQLAQCPAS